MSILDITQWLALILYGIVFIYAGVTTGTIRKSNIPKHFKHLIQTALIAISVQAGIYISLQWDWIVNNYSSSIGILPDSLWLGHEILSGVFLFVIISIIRIGARDSINNTK